VEGEVDPPYAGPRQLCRSMVHRIAGMHQPQCEALRVAFGLTLFIDGIVNRRGYNAASLVAALHARWSTTEVVAPGGRQPCAEKAERRPVWRGGDSASSRR
jgi:hypothetical protein